MFEWPKPAHCTITGGEISVERYSQFQAVKPLGDDDFFVSFSRLGARGEPSNAKVCNWVSKYGLPTYRGGEWGEGPTGSSMSVRDFKTQVRDARQLAHLYAEIANHNVAAIRVRITKPETLLDRELRKAFRSRDYRNLKSYVEGGLLREGAPDLYLSLRVLVEKFVADYVRDVSIRPTVEGPYSVAQSYRCPDLLSALYLQFFLLILRRTPMRYCEHPNCRTPFPATRNNKRFCCQTCRSGARYHGEGEKL